MFPAYIIKLSHGIQYNYHGITTLTFLAQNKLKALLLLLYLIETGKSSNKSHLKGSSTILQC